MELVLTKFVRIIDGSPVVVTGRELRRDPQISFPENLNPVALADHDIFPLVETAPPDGDGTEDAIEAAPELVGGEWQQRWTLQPRPVVAVIPKGAFVRAVRTLPAGKVNQFRQYVQGLTGIEAEDFANARSIRRNGWFIDGAQTALGATDQQVDNLFRRAMRLSDSV